MTTSPWLLAVAMLLPFGGALFALALPARDRLALRSLGVATSALSGAAAVAASWPFLVVEAGAPVLLSLQFSGPTLALDAATAPLLTVCAVLLPLSLRGGAARIVVGSRAYVVVFLVFQGLATGAMLVSGPLLSLSLAQGAAIAVLSLVALYGGPERGSAVYRVGMLWLVLDGLALSALAWLAHRAGDLRFDVDAATLLLAGQGLPAEVQAAAAACVAAAGLWRLCAGPFFVWVGAFFDEAPAPAAVLAVSVQAAVGAHLLMEGLSLLPGGLAVVAPVSIPVLCAAAVLAGVLAVAERDLRRLIGHAAAVLLGVASACLLSFDARAQASGIALVVAAGASLALALMVLDAVERRLETRDVFELMGLSHRQPLLAPLLSLSLLSLGLVPGLGAGVALWRGAYDLARVEASLLGALPFVVVAALLGAVLLLCGGVAGAIRRVATPPAPKDRGQLLEVTAGQALRLVVPAVLALLVGALSPQARDTALLQTTLRALSAAVAPPPAAPSPPAGDDAALDVNEPGSAP